MFFDTRQELWRVLVTGVLAYTGVVILQRLTGRRILSKMNAFDFIVTVASGSGLATVILSRDVALAEGLPAFVVLMLLQFVVSRLIPNNHLAMGGCGRELMKPGESADNPEGESVTQIRRE